MALSAEQQRYLMTPLPVIEDFKLSSFAPDAKSKYQSWRRSVKRHMEQKALMETAFADDATKAAVKTAWSPKSSMVSDAAVNPTASTVPYTGFQADADDYLHQQLVGKVKDDRLNGMVENMDGDVNSPLTFV